MVTLMLSWLSCLWTLLWTYLLTYLLITNRHTFSTYPLSLTVPADFYCSFFRSPQSSAAIPTLFALWLNIYLQLFPTLISYSLWNIPSFYHLTHLKPDTLVTAIIRFVMFVFSCWMFSGVIWNALTYPHRTMSSGLKSGDHGENIPLPIGLSKQCYRL